MKTVVVGAGAFGFALAKYLGDKYLEDPSIELVLLDKNADVISHIATARTHPIHYPDVPIARKIKPTTDPSCVRGANIILLVVPTQLIRSVIRDIRPYVDPDALILNAGKGIEIGTCKRPSEIISEELRESGFRQKIAAFSGGTIASEMIMGAPLGAEIACEDHDIAAYLQRFMASDKLRIYANTDIRGVEYAGALKNVVSIAAGISDGLRNAWGTKTLLISRASAEVKRLALKLGAQAHTFSAEGQAWCNDLWMSCTGNTRNRHFGEMIGRELSVDRAIEIMARENKLVEGYYTTKAAYQLAQDHNVDAPIISAVYDVLYRGKNPREAMNELMSRSLKFLGEDD